MIAREREKKIVDLAEYVNEEYSDVGYIDPEKIAEAKEITFNYGNYNDAFDGMLEYSQGKFHVYINLFKSKYPSSGRSRFTFCHELGHYFLDEHRNALITGASQPHKSTIDFRSELKVEREADIFAANLLIPEKILGRKIGKSKLSAGLVLNQAEFFGSSITSTAIRILKLSHFPFLLLKSENGKILWSWPSDELKDLGLKYPIKQISDLNNGSLTHTYSDIKLDPSTILKQGTTASVWYSWIDEKSHRNIIMIEEIISLGEHGILTLAYPDSH